MAKTVNYAGTVLGLNTEKYTKSLNTLKTQSASCANSIKNSFKGMAAGLTGAFSAVASFNKIVNSLKDYESKVSSLSAITGNIEDAKILFNDLNNLSRKIPQQFDDITAAAVNLNKSGIVPTEENIKALSAIAVGTNNTLAGVSQVVTSAALGQVKALKQLGIVAKATGDQIEVSYKGQQTVIDNTSESIMKYINDISKNNFAETLNFQMRGMTGATKNLSDAWSDMWTAIATGDVGREIADSIYTASRALDSFTAWLKSAEVQQALGGIVRAFKGAFSTIANGLSNLWQPFSDFFSNLSDAGEKTCKAEIGYFEGWFDFVRLGLGDITAQLDTWYKQLQAYAERAGSIIAQTVHGTTYEVMNRADLSIKMLAKIKELGLENTALVKRSGKVDLSAILQLPKGHPLLDYYMTERKRVTDANKQMKDAELASEDAFQKQLADIEKKNDAERKKAYDDLIQTRINLQNSLKTKSLNYDDIFKMSGAGTSGSTAASSAARKLAEETDKARKAYENLNAEIQRMKFNSLDAIEQENSTYADRMTVLKTALEQNAITQEQYRTTEQELTQLHLDKLSELYNEHYEREAEKRNQALQEMKQREEDWNSNSTVLDQFSEKIAKYNLNWANLISGDFSKAKLTGTQIVGVYSQAGKAISDYFGSVAQGFEKNSGIYKGLFALQKGFAVASSMISMYQGAMNAMAAPYPANLLAWAQVIGQGLQIIGQLKSINYTGAYDKGGYIPGGAVGLVGEIGPELIRGPATVTGRKDTEELMKNNGSNVTVNLIEDSSRAGQVQQRTDNDQQTIIDVIVANIRNGGEVANAMSGTYGLARQGY
jgi:hypothetical protein